MKRIEWDTAFIIAFTVVLTITWFRFLWWFVSICLHQWSVMFPERFFN
jgi:hypothetical protein